MKCFRHPDVDAVALCKQCCKALCAACAVEGQGGISCSGTCAEKVERQHTLLHGARQSLGAAAAALRRSAYFMAVAGAAMLVLGLVGDLSIATTMGAVLLAFGLFGTLKGRKFPRP
jgi:hypothetical protein